jgi:hypothetical protein
MLTIEIHDPQLAQRLQEIAEQERRPVEDVLKVMVSQYTDTPQANAEKPARSEAVMRVRRNAFAEAREYWSSVGDEAKATLTDEALDEQFAWFDDEGIPRLKAELSSLEPSKGTLAYAAKVARELNLRADHPTDAAQADDILNAEFADYLLQSMRGDDATDADPRR